jgi:hypothetical protein
MTKDFLRDFRHGGTVHGGQETVPHAAVIGYVKLQTSEDTCEGVCAAKQRTETQGNLVGPGFSKPHTDDGTKALILRKFRVGDLVVMQKR